MEDKITPSNLYANIPMTINELIIQGTMFPNFDRTEYLYRVLHLVQGNDSISDEMFSKVIGNMNKGVPPPIPTHKLEMNEVMDLALKEWRPPVWASQKIADAPPVPSALAAEEPRPTVLLTHHIVAQLSGGSPPSQYQRPLESSRSQGGAHPSGKKARGAVPELPYGAPSTFASVNDWVKFIHQYQNQSDNFDKSSKLSRMFPGALGFSLHPDDDEVEVNPPSQQDNVWLCKLIKLLTVKANGITYHNADDALKWAWRVGNEYVAQVISNGGDKDPNTKAIIDKMRATLNEPLPVGEHHSLEWIDLQAHVLGVTPESIAPYEAHPIKERDLCVLEEFAKLAALYDLSHHARGEGSNAGGVIPIPANTLEEGEMEDDLRPM
ncbi:hypothetical protein EDC04DRAFT_2603657 [Pisolithus marmoratus]|nr:hypothetical protein EDC04DRAFT_2603657 [Pisolithus marmoratus]